MIIMKREFVWTNYVWTNLSIFWNGNRAVDKTHPARSTCLKYKKILTFKTKQIPNTKTSYENTFFAFRFQFELCITKLKLKSKSKELILYPCEKFSDGVDVKIVVFNVSFDRGKYCRFATFAADIWMKFK